MSNDLSSKKATSVIDISKLPRAAQSEINSLDGQHMVATYVGIGNKKRKNWDTPKYNAAEGEHIIKSGNAFIILGRDRETDVMSGFGGKGAYHCAAIDLVVGRGAAYAKSIQDDGTENLVDPDFKVDAARVYISQKADIDTYLALDPDVGSPKERRAAGYTTEESPRSTVAIKADTLRFVSRENIKIITRTDRRNAQGGLTNNAWTGRYGIDLVAMNDFEGLQPMVMGDNLKMCLESMVDSIASLRTLYISYNNDFQKKVMTHTHISPFFGITVPPAVQDLIPAGAEFFVKSALNAEVPCMLQHSQETNTLKSDFLGNDGGSRGKKYILSTYNRSN